MKALGIRLFFIVSLLAVATVAQAQNKVMQVHSGGSVVYALNASQVDSITFNSLEADETTDVLMLKVDFTTNAFEGGYEHIFNESVKTFTISSKYKAPGDFGEIKLYFSEIDKLLFDGTIIWMGHGEIQYPASDKWLSASDFSRTIALDYVSPKNGFEEVLNYEEYHAGYFQYLTESEIEAIWSAVQSVVKVREYIKENPNQKVKMYLYTPTVGSVDPTVAKWIIFLNKNSKKQS